MEKVLITGTAGFIGHHLALKMAAEGYRVIGLDAVNDYYDVNLKYGRLAVQGIARDKISYGKLIHGDHNIAFIQLKMEDHEGVSRLFEAHTFKWVINLAAQAGVGYSLENPIAYINSNITGFLNILEGVRHNPVEHLVFASSSSVYGLNKAIPFSESHHTDHPISLYAATKKSDEMMAHCYAHLYNIPSTGLRFFTVYGPWGRPDMALFIFTKNILEGKPVRIFNYGDMMRDFTYIDDIIRGISGVCCHQPQADESFDHANPVPDASSAPYSVMNIGSHKPVKLMDFVYTLEQVLGKKATISYEPMQPGDVKATYASVQKLIDKTGYQPGTGIDYGVAQFVSWYRDFYKI